MSRLIGASGDEAALMKALYDEHAGPLWRYALRLTSDASRAEDVVQETLLRAWQHPEVIGDTERSSRPVVAQDCFMVPLGSAIPSRSEQTALRTPERPSVAGVTSS